MRIESTKGTATVDTIEAAAVWLVEMQPSYASIEGHDIASPGDEWTAENADRAVAAALSDELEDMPAFDDYCIAFVRADGSWDHFKTFVAKDDDDANAYAAEHYDGKDWYVLDARGRNINGGDQE